MTETKKERKKRKKLERKLSRPRNMLKDITHFIMATLLLLITFSFMLVRFGGV